MPYLNQALLSQAHRQASQRQQYPVAQPQRPPIRFFALLQEADCRKDQFLWLLAHDQMQENWNANQGLSLIHI